MGRGKDETESKETPTPVPALDRDLILYLYLFDLSRGHKEREVLLSRVRGSGGVLGTRDAQEVLTGRTGRTKITGLDGKIETKSLHLEGDFFLPKWSLSWCDLRNEAPLPQLFFHLRSLLLS